MVCLGVLPGRRSRPRRVPRRPRSSRLRPPCRTPRRRSSSTASRGRVLYGARHPPRASDGLDHQDHDRAARGAARSQPRPHDHRSAGGRLQQRHRSAARGAHHHQAGAARAHAQERPGLRRDARDRHGGFGVGLRRVDEREGAQAGPARHALPERHRQSPRPATPLVGVRPRAARPLRHALQLFPRHRATAARHRVLGCRPAPGRALEQPPASLRLGGRHQVRGHRRRRLLSGRFRKARPASPSSPRRSTRPTGNRTRSTTWRCTCGRRRCTSRRPW